MCDWALSYVWSELRTLDWKLSFQAVYDFMSQRRFEEMWGNRALRHIRFYLVVYRIVNTILFSKVTLIHCIPTRKEALILFLYIVLSIFASWILPILPGMPYHIFASIFNYFIMLEHIFDVCFPLLYFLSLSVLKLWAIITWIITYEV